MQIARLSNFIRATSRRLSRKEGPPDQAELSDLSYEDALLDAQLRSFFHAGPSDLYHDHDRCRWGGEYGEYGERSSYGAVEAPDGVFARVVHSIQVYNEEQERRRRSYTGLKGVLRLAAQLPRQLGHVPGAIYRLGSYPGTSRALSGSLVAALLVLAIAPALAQSMNGHSVASLLGVRGNNAPQLGSEAEITSPPSPLSAQTPVQKASPAVRSEGARILLEQKTGEDFDAPVAAIQVEGENDLNPVERGMAPNKAKRSPDEPAPLRATGGEE